jgi:hypothetical protein
MEDLEEGKREGEEESGVATRVLRGKVTHEHKTTIRCRKGGM